MSRHGHGFRTTVMVLGLLVLVPWNGGTVEPEPHLTGQFLVMVLELPAGSHHCSLHLQFWFPIFNHSVEILMLEQCDNRFKLNQMRRK